METDSSVENTLDLSDSSKIGENSNLKENQVKGDKNFNFLRDNTFLNNENDCSELNLLSNKSVEQILENDSSSLSSVLEEDNENMYEQETVEKNDDFTEEGLVIETIDNSKEMDIVSKVDLKNYSVKDNLLEAEKKKNKDVMQMVDEEGEEEQCEEVMEEEEKEERGKKNEEMRESREENKENDSTIKNGGMKDKNGKDVEGENRVEEEEGEEKAFPFDENKGTKDVKEDDIEKEGEKEIQNYLTSSVDDENKVGEAHLDENMEVESLKEETEEEVDEKNEEEGTKEDEAEDTKKKKEEGEETEKEEEEGGAHSDENKEVGSLKENTEEEEDTKKEEEEEKEITKNKEEEEEVTEKEEEDTEEEEENSNEGADMNNEHVLLDEIKAGELLLNENKEHEDVNNEHVFLDEIKAEELLLNGNKGDEDMLSLYENHEMDEEELLRDGDQNDEEMLSLDKNKENEEVLIPDKDLKDEGKLSTNENDDLDSDEEMAKEYFSDKDLEDEGNASIDLKDDEFSKIAGVQGEYNGTVISDWTCSTPTTKSISQPAISSNSISCLKTNFTLGCTPSSKFISCSQPSSKPIFHSTPSSKPTTYCTPAKTVLKYWKPSVFRRSRVLFTSNPELNKTVLDVDATPEKCSTIQEEDGDDDDDDDDDDDFDTSLMKLEQKLAEIENEHETSPNFSKTCSKMEAYHKTIVAERKEDCQKLEEVMAELSSQIYNFQKGLSQDSQCFSQFSTIDEDDEGDVVMQEFLEGKDDGLMVVEDIDFANEQNDTVIEMNGETSVVHASMEDNEEDVLRSTCLEISGLNVIIESGTTLSSDVVESGPTSRSDVESGPTSRSDVELESTSSSNVAEIGLTTIVVSGATLTSDVVKLGPTSGSDVELGSTDSDVFMLESKSSVVSESNVVKTWSTSSVVSESTSSDAIKSGSTSSDAIKSGSTSSDAIKTGSTSSDVSGSTLSSNFVQLVSETTLNSDVVKLGPTSSVVSHSTTSSSDVVDSGSTTNIEEKATSNVVITSSAEPVLESTSKSDVVELESKSSADIKVETTSNVVTTSVPESTESNSEVSSSNVVSTSSEVIKIVDDCKNDDFVSDDPLENNDNFHPNWQIWRNLTNDRDRYREISKRWRNMTIPNPNVNLTHHNFMQRTKIRALNQIPNRTFVFGENLSGKKNKKRRKELNKKRKYQEAFQRERDDSCSSSSLEPPAKRQRCTIATEIFNNEINDLMRKLESKRYMIQSHLNDELTQMAIRQEQEMFDCVYRYNGNHQQLQCRQIQEVHMLTDTFQQKLIAAEQETSNLVSMLRMSTEEVKTFHAFYEDLQDDNGASQFITINQLDELLETEFMISTYQERYGFSNN